MFCDQCGKKLPDDARFCDVCGAPMHYAPLVKPEPPVEVTELPVQDTLTEVAETAEPLETVMPEPAPGCEPIPQPVYEPIPEAVYEPIPQPVYEPIPAPDFAPMPQTVMPAEPEDRPEAPKPVKRRKPHIGLRIPMQFLTFLLCLVLMASLIATVVLADLNRLTSAGGIKQIINTVLLPSAAPASGRQVGAGGVDAAEPEQKPEAPMPDLGDLDLEGFDPGQLPEDIFTGDDPIGALVEWIVEAVEEQTGEELPVTKEQIQAVVEKSTVTDFIAEKVAGYADDYINGTANTTITTDEILDLIEENEQLLKEELNIELTPEDRQELEKVVEEVVVEAEIDRVIREEVFTSVDQAIEESTESLGGLSREEIMDIIQTITATRTLLLAIGVCLLLMLLICGLNFYNIPGGLTWISIFTMLTGLILSAPVALLQLAPDFVRSLVPDLGEILPMLSSFVGVLALFHYGLFVFGVVVLIGSIVWRILRSARAKKRSLAAA